MDSQKRASLTAQHSVLEVLPASGGCIARFAVRTAAGEVDILRPAGGGDADGIDPRQTACFPLVPYSGRIRDGRFVCGTREVREPLNFAPERHSIHGHGWQRPWRVEAQDASTLTLAYTHAPDDWPYAYTARQCFRLDPPPSADHLGALAITVSLTNESDEPMPAGLGLHPYFARTPGAHLSAQVSGVWLTDDEVMPVEHAGLPASMPLPGGIHVDRTPLDHAFTGFGGVADIEWPERKLKVRLRASPLLGFLVVYTPPGEDFFCVEPVSNCTDAFNLAAAGCNDTGMLMLEPERTVRAEVRLEAAQA
ncbi:MAG: aldose 1-epimerase [Gammaproteobacteria bacterium]